MAAKQQGQMSTSEVAEVLGAQEVPEVGGAVAVPEDAPVEIRSQFTAKELAETETFADAIQLAQNVYGQLISSAELGDGYQKLEDKTVLVGVPFIIMGWGLGWSEFGDQTDANNRFSVLRVLTDRNERFRIVDGSTGIHQSLMEKFEGNPSNFVPVVALNGLTYKDYTPRNPDGSPLTDAKGHPVGKARTFRIEVESLTVGRK